MRKILQASRALARRPLASSLVIGALALGIGSTVAISAVYEAVLDRALPARQPDRLVYFASRHLETGGLYPIRLHEALLWRDAAHSLESLAITRSGSVHLKDSEGVSKMTVSRVSPEYFSVLGVEPELGRGFEVGDISRPSVLLSQEVFNSRFGGDRRIVGETLEIDGQSHTVLGVMPAGPQTGVLAWRDLWLPLEIDEAAAKVSQQWGYSVIARLAEGVDFESAKREMASLAQRLAVEHPDWNEGWGVEARPIREWMNDNAQQPLRLLMWAAFLVLTVACVTSANVLYAATMDRRREMSIRRALGAGRGSLLVQLLSESTILASIAGLVGLAAAAASIRIAASRLPPELGSLEGYSPSPKIWLAAALATAGAAIVCSLIATVALRRPAFLAIRQGGEQNRRLRASLVAVETALATVAVIGSLLLVRSLEHVQAVDPGFETAGLLTLRLELTPSSIPEKQERIAAFENLLAEISALPGVEDAATAGFALPLTGGAGAFQLYVEGKPRGPRPDVVAHAQVVSPGFFETFGIPLVAGRGFRAEETWDSGKAAVVNQAFARMHWPEKEALGRFIEFANGERGTIVGIVGDVHQLALDRDANPEVYLAWGTAPESQALVVRTAGAAAPLASSVRRRIEAVMPFAPIYDLRTASEIVRSSYATRELTAWTSGAFAAMAHGLGLVGLYGLVLFLVTSRRRDIGIRLAVGATPTDLARWVLSFGLAPVSLGLAIGLGVSLAAGRLLESQLFGVSAGDPALFATGAAVVLVSALLIAWFPTRRALAMDPSEVLRAE